MYKLLYGDCLQRLPKLPDKSVDMVLCDLPYGMTAMSWDKIIDLKCLWKQYRRICKGVIILTCSQPFTTLVVASNIKHFKHEYIWFKNVPTGMASANYAPMKYHENILVFSYGKVNIFNKILSKREGIGKGCYKYEHYCGDSNHVKMKKVKKFYNSKLVNPSTVLLFNTVPNRKGKLHPTQKPIALLKYLIKTYSNEGMVVLDNCMGSGSIGIACLCVNRKFIGIEKDKKYFKVAKVRLEKQKLRLLRKLK